MYHVCRLCVYGIFSKNTMTLIVQIIAIRAVILKPSNQKNSHVCFVVGMLSAELPSIAPKQTKRKVNQSMVWKNGKPGPTQNNI